MSTDINIDATLVQTITDDAVIINNSSDDCKLILLVDEITELIQEQSYDVYV